MNRFYRRHYEPQNLVVAAAGNLEHEELVRQLRRHMDIGRALRPGQRSDVRVRRAGRAPSPSGKSLTRRRATEQSHIVLGTAGLARTDPDRFAFLIANTALGGGMSSRLFQEVRERRGLAYSVFSYHQQFTETGQFAAYAGTTPSRTEEVVGLLREQVGDVASGAISESEFRRAKDHVKGSLVLAVEDPGSRMSRIGRSEIAEGEILTVAQTLRRIEQVRLQDAVAVAERVLSQPMTLTVLGPVKPSA